MFISRLNNALDRFDPYWDCRMIAYKTLHVCIIILIALFILKPLYPVLFVLLTPFVVIATELPQVPDYRSKDVIFVVFYLVMALAVFVFCFVSYFRVLSFIFAFSLCFLVYYLIYKKQSQHSTGLGMVPGMLALMLDMGHIHLNNGGFFTAINQTIVILISGLIAFWGHKIFPNFYHYKWKSTVKRLLETWQKLLHVHSVVSAPSTLAKTDNVTTTQQTLQLQLLEHLRHLRMLDRYLIVRKDKLSIFRFSQQLWDMYYKLNNDVLVTLPHEKKLQLARNLQQLYQALMTNQQAITSNNITPQHQVAEDLLISETTQHLTHYWNQLCLKM